jgi:hypothetical protein
VIAGVKKWLVISGYAFFAAVFWSFVTTGICRIVFKLEENVAMGYIGIPLFIVLMVWFCRMLPKHLRKAGVLRDH